MSPPGPGSKKGNRGGARGCCPKKIANGRLLKETEREGTIRKRGAWDVNGNVNGVAEERERGKGKKTVISVKTTNQENEREIRRLDNESVGSEKRGRGRQRREWKIRKEYQVLREDKSKNEHIFLPSSDSLNLLFF